MTKRKLYELVNNEWVREIFILFILAVGGFLLFRALPEILNLILKLLNYE
ncbi:MAG: hypothetical protein WBL27_04730 [Salinimicrobium sp.]